jgi:membrane protease YdiL (CAAX protease family)
LIGFFLKRNIIFASQISLKKMIQRVQTIFMFIVVFIMGGLFIWFPEVKNETGELLYTRDEPLFFALIFISIALAIIAIFSYKKRKNQFVFNRLNILTNFILLGVFVYRSLTVSGETLVSEKGIGIFLPILSIVFLVLANRAIQKDENLVKSVDRLR